MPAMSRFKRIAAASTQNKDQQRKVAAVLSSIFDNKCGGVVADGVEYKPCKAFKKGQLTPNDCNTSNIKYQFKWSKAFSASKLSRGMASFHLLTTSIKSMALLVLSPP